MAYELQQTRCKITIIAFHPKPILSFHSILTYKSRVTHQNNFRKVRSILRLYNLHAY